MRFRDIRPHEGEITTPPSVTTHASQQKKPMEVVDLGEVTGAHKAPPRESLPLEWEPLRAFIEAEKAAQIHQDNEAFIQRLMPRIEQAQLSQQVIQDYRRQTCWSRWALRATAAAAIVGLLLVTYGQHRDLMGLHKEVRDLRAKVSTLEARAGLQQAGL
ncbi:MAG TPA: hypothetical protein PLA90_09680 [Candidatus Sumerlaeota bacterium]|nr:hypothetical protein [Candidatus Sumerlaeota bacterium]HPS01802.1 hypothetical protein [Candidatus Sumerlaeota bacterium]